MQGNIFFKHCLSALLFCLVYLKQTHYRVSPYYLYTLIIQKAFKVPVTNLAVV